MILLLALGGAGFIMIAPFQKFVRGLAMLFTQKSAQTLAGAISVSAFPMGRSILYAVFQGLILPQLPPLIMIGNTIVFGAIRGLIASSLGALAAGSAGFWISRVLLRDLTAKAEPVFLKEAANEHGVLIFAGLGFIFWKYFIIYYCLSGLSAISYKNFLAALALSRIPVVVIYALLCDVYKPSPPQWIMLALTIAGVLLVLIGVLLPLRKNKQG